MFGRTPDISQFARFQCVHDLRELLVACESGDLARISDEVPGMPPIDLLMSSAGSKALLDSETVAFHDALSLAAARPDLGHDAFVFSTSLLLADRLQDGAGTDDLFWHYDAHAETYARLGDDERSAILMAYALLDAEGSVRLSTVPGPEFRSARPGGLVRAALAAAPANLARTFRAALDGGDGDETEALWRSDAQTLRSIPAIAGAARHLYASRPDWDPYRAWSTERIAAEGIAIPYPCPLPLPHVKGG